VVLVTHGVVMLVVPPGSSIDGIDGLKGKTVRAHFSNFRFWRAADRFDS
jgi:hypothetical protein